jgi:hypothetical protein
MGRSLIRENQAEDADFISHTEHSDPLEVIHTFLMDVDTPATYSGSGSRVLAVSGDETGIIFADHTLSVFGNHAVFVESNTLSSTSNTTYQTKIFMTFGASIPPGIYRIGWYMEYNAASANKDVYVRMYNPTDDVVYTENRAQTNDSGNWFTLSGFKYAALAGLDKTFALQYMAGMSSCNVRNALIEIWRDS